MASAIVAGTGGGELGQGLRSYPLTLLLPMQAGFAAFFALLALVVRPVRYGLSLIGSYVVLLLFVGWYVGGMQIPGGDDGTGLRWFFVGAPSCLVA